MTFNEDLFDAMVRHQIGLLRFSGSIRNDVWALLDAVEGDLRRQIVEGAARAGFRSQAERRALRRLLRRLRETRVRAWEEVTPLWRERMRELARREPEFYAQILRSTVPVELGLTLPAAEELRAIVTHQAFVGRTLNGWAKNVRDADLSRMEAQIRTGLAQNETPRQVARRIVGTVQLRGTDGHTQVARRWANTITRTVAIGVAAEARRLFALENSDIIPRELFTATLDSRTTPICRRFDGEAYALDDPKRPVLPLHPGERSIYSPLLDAEAIGERPRRDFTERSLLREFAGSRGFDPVTKRAALPHGTKGAFDQFARRRMRELTGTVPARVSYGQWLARQTRNVQDDILGPTRARLFRSGDLSIKAFVEPTGRVLSLDELAERHTDAFLRAGLDPERFAA